MSRFTLAYSRFVQRLDEVNTLTKHSRILSIKAPQVSNAILLNAICRSGVVLLSSHIEGYIEDLGETAIDRVSKRALSKQLLAPEFRYYLSRDLIDAIVQTTDYSQRAVRIENLIKRDLLLWNHEPNFPNNLSGNAFLSDFANPKHKRICKFFRRFGYDQFESDLRGCLKQNFLACSNMVDQVVDQRNKIAHGDLLAVPTPSDLQDMLDLVRQYCNAVDRVVAAWFLGKGCAIR